MTLPRFANDAAPGPSIERVRTGGSSVIRILSHIASPKRQDDRDGRWPDGPWERNWSNGLITAVTRVAAGIRL